MESFCFQEELLVHEAMLYYATFSPPPSFDDAVTAMSDITSPASSAFVEYSSRASNLICLPKHNEHGAPNVHQRIMSLLIKSMPKPKQKRENSKNMDEYHCSREFRHMMRERQRREKLSQSYSDLYSILVPRYSKADKKSIVQSATVHIKELKKVKEEVHMRNKELREKIEMMMMMMDHQDKTNNHVVRPAEAELAEAEAGTSKIIGVRLMNPASTIDSMIGALQCVKGMGAMATTIHSDFSAEQFTAVMTIQTKIERSEVEQAVEKTLMETERKLRLQLLGSGGWAHQHLEQDQLNVEN